MPFEGQVRKNYWCAGESAWERRWQPSQNNLASHSVESNQPAGIVFPADCADLRRGAIGRKRKAERMGPNADLLAPYGLGVSRRLRRFSQMGNGSKAESRMRGRNAAFLAPYGLGVSRRLRRFAQPGYGSKAERRLWTAESLLHSALRARGFPRISQICAEGRRDDEKRMTADGGKLNAESRCLEINSFVILAVTYPAKLCAH